MKKLLFFVSAMVIGASTSFSQIQEGGKPLSMAKKIAGEHDPFLDEFAAVNFQSLDMNVVNAEDALASEKDKPYRIGVLRHLNISPETHGTWITLADGTRVWRLKITSRGAKTLALNFSSKVMIPEGGKLFAYNKTKTHIVGAFGSETDGFEAMQVVEGDEITLEYAAPGYVSQLPVIQIENVSHNYRGFEDFFTGLEAHAIAQEKAESCQVDVACVPESTGWTNEINATVHFTFNDGSGTFVCSGATVNNTGSSAGVCKPYILTAWHCGERQSSASSLAQWTWYWKYQKASCATGAANASNTGAPYNVTMTGGTLRASSGNGTLNNPPTTNEVAGSDFYLAELNSLPPASYNVYYAGWDRSNTAATSGKGIHHPAGSAKKISTYTTSLASSTYNGGAPNGHWRVIWAATTNGHGVTEGGSSGSPIFNQNHQVVGQLSGGSSFCNATSQPDLYGKMFTNWDQCGTAANAQLKPWLDPSNTGVTSLAGVAAPCTATTPVAPVANFSANATAISVGTTVQFTDLSTGAPSSWAWTVSPATGWSYAGGTSATSQNPQITFTTAGSYTITLVATNAQGNDSEVKNAYIVVTTASAPCTATAVQTCGAGEEYIKIVTMNTINNTTGCGQYSNTNIQTTVTKGLSYTMTVSPHIVGNAAATTMYQGDEIGVWVDYNNNLTFETGERVGTYISPTNTGLPTFNITIPATAITGTVWMRVRIVYADVANGGQAMDPCGSAPFGETEDYKLVIQANTDASLEDQNPFEHVAVYPNPSTDVINTDLSAYSEQDITVELLDVSGKVLATQKNVAGTIVAFSVTDYAKGLYQVRISTANSSAIKRVVKL